MSLILDADRLDAAATALRLAGEGVTAADGRKLAGPQLGHDAYRNWIVSTLERIMGVSIRPSDEPAPDRLPEDTW